MQSNFQNTKNLILIIIILLLSRSSYAQSSQTISEYLKNVIYPVKSGNPDFYNITKDYNEEIIFQRKNPQPMSGFTVDSPFKFTEKLVLKSVKIRVMEIVPDSISIYFSNQRIIKCDFHFFTPKYYDHFYSLFKNRFGPVNEFINNLWLVDKWEDNGSSLMILRKKDNLQNIIVEIDLTNQINPDQVSKKKDTAFPDFSKANSNNQNTTTDNELESQIKIDRRGSGNGSFLITIPQLEGLIKQKSTLKSLENRLASWVTFGGYNKLGYEYDESSKSFSIPLFQIRYESSIKGKAYIFNVEVIKSLFNPIKYFEFLTTFNGLQLAELKQSILKNNYLLNENLSSILKKLVYQNRSKDLMISIKSNSNSTYSVGIR